MNSSSQFQSLIAKIRQIRMYAVYKTGHLHRKNVSIAHSKDTTLQKKPAFVVLRGDRFQSLIAKIRQR